MTERHKNRIYLIPVVLILFSVSIWMIGLILVYFNSGATFEAPKDYSQHSLDEFAAPANWIQDGPNIIEDPGLYQREIVKTSYLRAWQSLNIFQMTGDSSILEDYFSLDLQRRLIEGYGHDNHLVIKQADLSHTLSLQVFSLDKQFISFRDLGARILKNITDPGSGEKILHLEESFDFDVVMTLDDGKWKVRHWIRNPSSKKETVNEIATSDFVNVANGSFLRDEKELQIAGVNYYSQENPWFDFWPDFEPSVIEEDFDLIRSLGFNTVRVFIPFQIFGGKQVHPTMLDKMEKLLDLADSRDLLVIPTLFDFPPGYEIQNYSLTERQLESILVRFKDSSGILAWDIKNEPDLDFENYGKAVVIDWLEFMTRRARVYDPNHLITIGWSNAQAATNLTQHLDFVSFHFYKKLRVLGDELQSIAKSETTRRPILISETGIPSYRSFLLPGGYTENQQAKFYQDFITIVKRESNAHYLAWTLFDFPQIPKGVFGPAFWRELPQKHFGLIRQDQTIKPAAKIIQNHDASKNIKLGIVDYIKPFYFTIFLIILASIIGSYLIIKRSNRA